MTMNNIGYTIWTLYHPSYFDQDGYYRMPTPYWVPIRNFKMPCTKDSLVKFIALHDDIFDKLKESFSINYPRWTTVYAISFTKGKNSHSLNAEEMKKLREEIISKKEEIIKKNQIHYARIAWRWKMIPYKFRHDPVPCLLKGSHGTRKTHGHSGLRSTVAFNTDPDYLEFSDTEYLMKSERIKKWDWDFDGTRRIRRNWKKQYKVRKQWEIHLPKHFDRIDYSKLVDEEDEDFDEDFDDIYDCELYA